MIQVGLKFNDKCPHKRKAEDLRQERRHTDEAMCDDAGRD